MKPEMPAFMAQPFAQQGDKHVIPDTSGADSGLASLAAGFPPITERPVINGGLPPQRQDFNGIFNWLSAFAFYAQSGGMFIWDAKKDYPVPAMVMYNNVIYVCKKENGPALGGAKTPGTDATYWVPLLDYLGAATKASVDQALEDMAGKLAAQNSTVNDAVAKLVGIADCLLAANGYVRFKNGLTLEWGSIAFKATDAYTDDRRNQIHCDKVFTYPRKLTTLYTVGALLQGPLNFHSQNTGGSDVGSFPNTVSIMAGPSVSAATVRFISGSHGNVVNLNDAKTGTAVVYVVGIS